MMRSCGQPRRARRAWLDHFWLGEPGRFAGYILYLVGEKDVKCSVVLV